MEKNPIEENSKEQKKFDKWRKSLMYITGLGLSIEDKKIFEIELEKDFEKYQCKRCEKWRDTLMKNSNISFFFLKKKNNNNISLYHSNIYFLFIFYISYRPD